MQPIDGKTNTFILCAVYVRNGVSECGVFIASGWLLEMADKYQEVDVYDTVFQIRSHRPQFIENIVSGANFDIRILC